MTLKLRRKIKTLDSRFRRNDGNWSTLPGIESAGIKTREKDKNPGFRLPPE